MVIVFTGLDGVGKSTQILKLKDRLESINKKVVIIQEPGTTPLGSFIRTEIIKSDKFRDINDITYLHLFSASRSELCSHLLSNYTKEELYGNDIVFIFSCTFVYQGAKITTKSILAQNILLNHINEINDVCTFGLRPQLTLHLLLDLEIVFSRLDSRKKDYIEEQGKRYFKRVNELYMQYYFENQHKENIQLIDTNNKSIDEIHEFIMSQLQQKGGLQ